MSRYDLIIVGGGISGLSMAHHALRIGWRPLLLERESRLGGCLHSLRLPGSGFWLELGAHTCYNSYGSLLALLDQTGLTPRLLARRRAGFRLWHDGRSHSIAAELSYAELALAPFRHGPGRTESTLAERWRARVGRGNFERVVGPALSAVICQDAGAFDAGLLFHKRPRRRGLARSYTLPDGLQSLVEALARAPGLTRVASAPVHEVTRLDHGWRVLAGEHEYSAPRLALALPAPQAARLLQAAAPQVAALAAQVETVPVSSIGVVVHRESIALPPLAGLIGRNAPFWSMVSRDPVPDPAYRGFTFHLRPGVQDGAAVAERVLGVGPERFEAMAGAHATLPALRPGHARRVAALDRLLAGQSLALTGNWFHGVAIEDCVARSAAELRRLAG